MILTKAPLKLTQHPAKIMRQTFLSSPSTDGKSGSGLDLSIGTKFLGFLFFANLFLRRSTSPLSRQNLYERSTSLTYTSHSI